MKKTDKPKLNVNIETVRPLTNDELDDAAGGKSAGCATYINCIREPSADCIAPLSDGCYTIKTTP
jgi:hypothetical protein